MLLLIILYFIIFTDDISDEEEYPEDKNSKDEASSNATESSPFKESLLNKFSKFSTKSPNPSINNGDPIPPTGMNCVYAKEKSKYTMQNTLKTLN